MFDASEVSLPAGLGRIAIDQFERRLGSYSTAGCASDLGIAGIAEREGLRSGLQPPGEVVRMD